MYFKKIFSSLILLLVISPPFLNAATVKITAYNAADQAAMNNIENQINATSNLKTLTTLSDLARGMADANAATSHAGSPIGFQNYEIFSVSAGYMLAYQLPKLGDSSDVIEDDIRKDGDAYAGASFGLTWINVGINASFITKGLYLSFRYGGIDTDFDNDEGFIKSSIYGVGVNYNFISNKSILGGLANWRGVSLGTGFIYHKTEIEFQLDFEEAAYTSGSYSYSLKPDINTDMYTVTIPLEAVTSIQAFYLLNLSCGAGIDLNFGSADVTVSDEVLDNSGAAIAKVDINGTNTTGEAPTLIRPRLMAGIGANLGPAKLEIPFTYYIPSGWSVGVTVAAVW